jgi:hypothetical protein
VAGPFVVTWPNDSGITWLAKNLKTISWNPANTQNPPISVNLVNILLSLDGGTTYPITLLSNVPNTGSANFTMTDLNSTKARIMVIAATGQFFAISKNNFTISTPQIHLDKADRNPMNYHEAFILYSGLNLDPLSSYQLNGLAGASIRLDATNQRFVISNINTPRAIPISIRITFNDNSNQTSNTISIPGVL